MLPNSKVQPKFTELLQNSFPPSTTPHHYDPSALYCTHLIISIPETYITLLASSPILLICSAFLPGIKLFYSFPRKAFRCLHTKTVGNPGTSNGELHLPKEVRGQSGTVPFNLLWGP